MSGLALHGRIEQFIGAATFFAGNQSGVFHALVDFFTTSQAASLGITQSLDPDSRFVPSTGSYWGSPTAGPYGEIHRTATIQFTSASVPFTVVITHYLQTTPFTLVDPTTGQDIGLPGNSGGPYGPALSYLTSPLPDWPSFPFGNPPGQGGPNGGANLWGNIDGNTSGGGIGIIVYQAFSGSTLCYPRANNAGGNYSSAGSGGAATFFPLMFASEWNTAKRVHVLATANDVLFLIDVNNTSDYRMAYFGLYDPHSGSNIQPQVPYFAAFNANLGSYLNNGTMIAMNPVRLHGDVAGTGTLNITNGGGYDGGMSHPTASLGVFGLMFDSPVNMTFAFNHPNTLYATSSYDQFPMALCFCEFNHPNLYGNVGQHNHFMRWVGGLTTHDTNADKTRAVFGTANHGSYGGAPSLTYTKISVPWDGATTPGTGNTSTGVTF